MKQACSIVLMKILNEYDANADLHQQVDVLHRAITQAAVTVSEGVPETDRFDVEFNFIFDLIEALNNSYCKWYSKSKSVDAPRRLTKK